MSTIAVVVLTYVKPLDQVDAKLAAHVEWLKQGYADGIFLASGRKIPRSGGVILAKGDDYGWAAKLAEPGSISAIGRSESRDRSF
ncbi:YciL domain-containing protein [Klebsiella michiganensis]|uniref:YciL domain-containing protein n=1 Tax=Klebsiella michiganensis TaxID=1134687 RepID=A0A7H4N1P7_9ENTR|nr:YciL domain-containing protein [Klebsiella michiganensis]